MACAIQDKFEDFMTSMPVMYICVLVFGWKVFVELVRFNRSTDESVNGVHLLHNFKKTFLISVLCNNFAEVEVIVTFKLLNIIVKFLPIV